MTNLDKAQRSEAMFLVYAAENSIQTAKPLFHSAPYDFVALIKSKWSTIQVKTCFLGKDGCGKSCIIVSLRHSGDLGNRKSLKPYQAGDYDYLFCVLENRYWMIPFSVCSHIKSTLTLGRKMKNYEVKSL